LEHKYVDNRAIADEIRNALQASFPQAAPVSEPSFT